MPPKALTNPARPVARYRKGKPSGPVASDSDSDADDAPAAASSDEDSKPAVGVQRAARPTAASFNVALKGVEVDERGAVTVGGRGEVGKTAREVDSEPEDSEGQSEQCGSVRRAADQRRAEDEIGRAHV